MPKKSAAGPPPLRAVLALTKRHPYRSTATVGLLLLSGLMEGIGIISLLPLLSIAANGAAGSTAAGGWVVDSLTALGLGASTNALLAVIVLGLSIKALLLVLAVRQAGYAGIDTATELRLDLIEALMGARWSYFVSQPSGAITNAVGSEAMRVTTMFTELCHLLAALIQLIVYLIIAMLIAWYLTVGALVFAGALFLFSSVPIRLGRRSGRSQTELMRSLIHRLTDSLGGLKALKAMGRESALGPLLKEEVRELNTAYRGEMLSRAILIAIQEPLTAIFLAVGIAVATSTLGMPLPEIIFTALIFQRVVSRFANAHSFYNSIGILESAYTSLATSIRESQQQKERFSGRSVPSLDHGIAFEDVSFAYDDHQVLAHVDAFIPAKQITAVSGESGTGKTTFVDLIVGLIEPSSGTLKIDSSPLREIDIRKWRDRIGYVGQEVVLLHESVFNNVALHDKTITEEDVVQALRQAEALDFVSSLPEGVHTVVGERGQRFSGGQRQRLAIARALVRKPLLLILDEVTTALDPAAEESIAETISTLSHDTTIVAISHQPALVAKANHVIRVNGGTIRELQDPTRSA